MKIDLTTLGQEETKSISTRLGKALGLRPVLEFAERQFETGAMLDNTSGAYLFGPNPTVAPFAFHLVVFPPLSSSQIEQYERGKSVQLPSAYARLLCHFNGLRAGSMSIYGLYDTSFQKNPNAEAAYVPFDVIQERDIQKQQCRPYADMFPIGGVRTSSSENGVLVLTADGLVLLFNDTGKLLRSHTSVEAALEHETARGLANAV